LQRSYRCFGIQEDPDVSIGVKVSVVDFEVNVITDRCVGYVKMVTYLAPLLPTIVFQSTDAEKAIPADTGR
jgi:hypothetical protein